MDELNDKFKKSADDFSLIPSSGIWQNVERDIRRRELKKRFIIFFFLLAGILGGGIILFSDYSANNGVQPSLQTNHPKSVAPGGIQQNTFSAKRNFAKKDATAMLSVSEKKNQNILYKRAPLKMQLSNSVSFPKIENESISVTQKTSKQYDITANSSQQIQGNIIVSTIISPVENDSSKTPISGIIQKDSLQIETKKEPLLVINSDSLNQDVWAAKKDTIKADTPYSNWNISIGIAPAISDTKFDEEGDYRIIANYRDSSVKNLITWNYHLAITYQVIPEFEVSIGAGLISYVEQMLNKEAVYHYDTTVLTGPNPVPTITVSRSYFNINNDSIGSIKNKFSWLEIPTGISYNILPSRKFSMSLKPGISFNKLLHAEGYKYNYQGRSYEKITAADVRSWLVAYRIGLSFQYSIRNNLKIEITPGYTGFQKSIFISSYPFGQRFHQIEFQFSLRYRLK